MVPAILPFGVRSTGTDARPNTTTRTRYRLYQSIPDLLTVMVVRSAIEHRVLPHLVDTRGLNAIQATGTRTCSIGSSENGRVARGGIRALPRIVDYAVRD